MDRRLGPAPAAPEARRQAGQAQPSGTRFETARACGGRKRRGAADTRSAWSRLQTYEVMKDGCTLGSTRRGPPSLRAAGGAVSTTTPSTISTKPSTTSTAESDERLVLLVRASPSAPSGGSRTRPALALRPRRAAVADEEAADQERRADRVPAERERAGEAGAEREPEQERAHSGAGGDRDEERAGAPQGCARTHRQEAVGAAAGLRGAGGCRISGSDIGQRSSG